MLFPTSPNKWVHLKESTWPHGPITFAKSQWICAVPRKTLANTRFDSNLISDNTFSVLTLQSFTFFCLKTHQTKKKNVYMRVALRRKHVSMRPASPKPFPTTKKDSEQEVPGNRLCLVSLWALPGAATVELLVVSRQCAFRKWRAYSFHRAISYRIYDAMFELDLSGQHLSTKMEQRAHDYNRSKQTHTRTHPSHPQSPPCATHR